MIRLLRPIELTANNFIYPIFIREDGQNYEIPSMKGQSYLSLDKAVSVCSNAIDSGISAIMVFGVLDRRDTDASIALKKTGFHSKIFKRLKKEFSTDLVLISNVCLCDYTSEEYCLYSEAGKILSKRTAEMLGKISVVHAEAGADIIAPAAMCDGQVSAIRQALDAAGFDDTSIMSYVKTNSCLFQPFFEAMTLSESPRRGLDSSRFRIDIINEKMFMQKVDLDVAEGADMIIVKPALTNLDLISKVKQSYPTLPIAAYQVSGEYAMMKLLCEHSHLDENSLILESLSSIRRAGADMILTYNAMVAAGLVACK
jgi:porphobilinogen synthase